MENNNQILEPEDKKSTKDFMKLLIGIIVFITALIVLKYLVSAMGIL